MGASRSTHGRESVCLDDGQAIDRRLFQLHVSRFVVEKAGL
jgi:hypothetical protein